MVYPCATHSRLSHSIGVFHTARQLAEVIRHQISGFDTDRREIALAAALVHDIGHGPFSHAFEDAMKQLDLKKRHEDWTAEIIRGDTQLGNEFENNFGSDVRADVAKLLSTEIPQDIYSAIVSSQFDADRLDYMRRDRLMTGAQHGGFDFSWLLANLEVDKIVIRADDGEQYAEVDSLILGPKAFQAAESYVLGLFQLYFTVYFHKATRSAEKMLSAVLKRVGDLIKTKETVKTGLDSSHPIVQFLTDPKLDSYLRLDDFVIWGSLSLMLNAQDNDLRDLSSRLLNRHLYKAVDITDALPNYGDQAKFRLALQDAQANGEFKNLDIFDDSPSRNPYKRPGYDSRGGLAKILIRDSSGTGHVDLAEKSRVVEALKQQSVFRVYVRNDETKIKIDSLIGKIK